MHRSRCIVDRGSKGDGRCLIGLISRLKCPSRPLQKDILEWNIYRVGHEERPKCLSGRTLSTETLSWGVACADLTANPHGRFTAKNIITANPHRSDNEEALRRIRIRRIRTGIVSAVLVVLPVCGVGGQWGGMATVRREGSEAGGQTVRREGSEAHITWIITGGSRDLLFLMYLFVLALQQMNRNARS